MMLYLTGAGTSLAKSPNDPQNDPSKSLGGYISSTTVPNAAVNALFDLISSYTLEKKQKETMAIALINKFPQKVTNVELMVVTDAGHEASFKVAAVPIDPSNMMMEKIANRYQEPFNADFYDADFYRAAVDLEITNPASMGEEIILYPFGITIEVQRNGIEGTWEAFEEAFYNDETYAVKRIAENIFRIERRDELVVTPPAPCSYITTAGFAAKFLSDFQNNETKSVLIKDTLEPGEAVGLWLQRTIKKHRYRTNEEILEQYKKKFILPTLEEVEIVINYQLAND